MTIDISKSLLGHAELDDDHQHLVAHLNSLAAEIPEASYELCVELFDSIERTAIDHFSREEAILEQAGFPGLERHRLYHAELIERIHKLRSLGWQMADKAALFQRFVEMANFVVEDVIHGDQEFKDYLVRY